MYLSDRNTTIASLIFNIFCLKSLLKKNVDPHVWSQARIRMYTDRRDRGEWKKRVIFPLVTIAASPLDFRRKQQQKNPSGTQGIRGYAAPGNF